MRRTATNTASAQNIGAGYVTVATIAAPAYGSSLIRLVVKFTALDVGHRLSVRETQGANDYDSGGYIANGLAKDQLSVDLYLAAGDASWVVAVKDTTGLSTAAAWTYEVYEILDAEPEVVEGTVVDTTPAAGDFDTNLTAAASGFYAGMACVFVTGNLRGPPRKVTASTTGTGNLAFTNAFPAAPANGDKFWLLGRIE